MTNISHIRILGLGVLELALPNQFGLVHCTVADA